MHRVAAVVALTLALAAAPPPATVGSAAPATPLAAVASGWLLVATVNAQGDGLEARLDVADSSGAVARSIVLPDPADPPARAMSTAVGGQALVETANGSVLLADATNGDVKRLDLPDGVHPGSPEWRSGRKWALLGDPTGSHAALVDLASGNSVDLTTLGSARSPLFGGAVSADDNFALITAANGLWLIPTGDPTAARQIGDAEAYGGAFIGDGATVLFCQPRASGQVAVMVAPAIGGSARTIATAARGAQALPRPGSASADVLLAQPGRLSLYSLASGAERPLPVDPGDDPWLRFAPSGRALLVGARDAGATGAATATALDGSSWRWIDLRHRRVVGLPTLAGSTPVSTGIHDRWLLFAPTPAPSRGGAGMALAALDLETGATRAVFRMDDPNAYYFPSPVAAAVDGAIALIFVTPASGSQLWLVDNRNGTSRLLAAGAGVAGAIAPDGQSVAAGQLRRSNGALTATFEVETTAGGRRFGRGDGLPLAWLRP